MDGAAVADMTQAADSGCHGLGMRDYYSTRLSSERLRACYELAPPPAARYLAAEIEHLCSRVPHGARVLELGCGYGRVLAELAAVAGRVVGVDTSLDSLRLARRHVGRSSRVALAAMDAVHLTFQPSSFDLVCAVQNGISAFHVDQRELVQSAVRVTRPGGTVLFSSYADEFWEGRLEWFRVQAAHGLVGEIDDSATRRGTIVCRDGFTATTVSPQQFAELSRGVGSAFELTTVAGSSLFCEISVA
jgi:SAM-dependent methyltransferase